MPMPTFIDALDDLITDWKDRGYDLGEMIADIEGMLDGLKAESDDE